MHAPLGSRRERFSCDDEVRSIGRRFLDRTLPKNEWTHRGHFAATLWLLRERPDVEVAAEMPDLIRAYNVATGVTNTERSGYHETITQASIRAARTFATTMPPSSSLCDIANALLDSPLGNPNWLLEFWTRQTLFSERARTTWCEPDIGALKFL